MYFFIHGFSVLCPEYVILSHQVLVGNNSNMNILPVKSALKAILAEISFESFLYQLSFHVVFCSVNRDAQKIDRPKTGRLCERKNRR